MARQFRFRLESVLDLRQRESRDAQAALAGALADLQARENDLAERRRYRDELLRSAGTGGTSVAELEARWYHARCVDAEISRIEDECGRLREIELRRRGELRDAMQKSRSLERLRERRFEQHRDDERRSEQIIMDEIAGRTGAAERRGRREA